MKTCLIEPVCCPSGANLPHLSYSRLNRYLLCPMQYRFHYVEGLRPRLTPAALVFGQAMHQALARYFQSRADPVECFRGQWSEFQETELQYSLRDSWEKLMDKGEKLLRLFVQDEAQRFGRVLACEKPFALSITGLGVPFTGVIDLVAEVDDIETVVDFKTSSGEYEEREAILSDQLTAYQLAEPGMSRSALCVFVKTKEPSIQWRFTRREGEEFSEFLTKARMVIEDIESERFYRRPGKWCGYCDYLPICIGDRQRAQECLVQAA